MDHGGDTAAVALPHLRQRMSHTIVGREIDPLETRGRRQFRRLVQVEPDDCIALDQLCDDRPADESAASRDDDNVSVSHPGLLKGYRYAGTRQRLGAARCT